MHPTQTRSRTATRGGTSAPARRGGFELNSITAPVSMWHRLADKKCPPGDGRWLTDQIRHAAADLPADDHTTIEEYHRSAAYSWILRTVRQQAR